jgi:hypothetical protein
MRPYVVKILTCTPTLTHFFVSNFLASEKLAPTPDKKTDYHTDYAYHFDASLLGEFLRNFSIENGVTHVSDTVSEVLRSENGDISGVETDQHGTIDCGLLYRLHWVLWVDY